MIRRDSYVSNHDAYNGRRQLPGMNTYNSVQTQSLIDAFAEAIEYELTLNVPHNISSFLFFLHRLPNLMYFIHLNIYLKGRRDYCLNIWH